MRIFTVLGNDHYVESVHVIRDTSDLEAGRVSLAESFEDLKVRKPQPEARPADFDAGYKQLVVIPHGGLVDDSGAWVSSVNGLPVDSSAFISLRNDASVTVKRGECLDDKGIAQLVANEAAKAINGHLAHRVCTSASQNFLSGVESPVDKRHQTEDVLRIFSRYCPAKPRLMGLRIAEPGDYTFNEKSDGILLIALCLRCTRVDWNSLVFRLQHILWEITPVQCAVRQQTDPILQSFSSLENELVVVRFVL